MPHATLMGKPGTAYLPRRARLNRMYIFPRLFYFDEHHENTMRYRKQTLGGFSSESSVEAPATESEESDMELQSAQVTVTQHARAA